MGECDRISNMNALRSIFTKKRVWALLGLELLLILSPLCFMPFAKQIDITIPAGQLIPAGEEGQDLETPELSLPAGVYVAEVDYLAETDGGRFEWEVRGRETDFHAFHADSFALYNDHEVYHFHIWADRPVTGLTGIFRYGKQEGRMEPELLRICSSSLTFSSLCVKLLLLCVILDLFLYYRVWAKERELLARMVPPILFLIAFAASLLLFKYGCTGQKDMDFHLYRLEGLKDGLLSGQFPVRVQPDWMNNHGYAVGIFYGDLFWFLPALMRIAGLTITFAYRFYVFTMNLATAAFAYLAFKNISKDRAIGLTCAAVYALCQYRLVDLYYRGAIGEFSALTFLPLVIWGLYDVLTGDTSSKEFKRGFLIAALGYSGMIQTHILSCEMAGLFTVLICLISLKRVFQWKRFIELCKIVICTIFMNLWFLVPFFDFFLRDKFFVNDGSRDAFTIQYIGTELQRVFAPLYLGMETDLPATPGGAVSLVLALGFVLALAIPRSRRRETEVQGLLPVYLSGVLATFMATNLFPYDALRAFPFLYKNLTAIQFPWRFFGLSAALLSFVLCGILAELKKYGAEEGREKERNASAEEEASSSADSAAGSDTSDEEISPSADRTAKHDTARSFRIAYTVMMTVFAFLAVFQGVEYQIFEDIHSDLTTYFCDTIGIPSFSQINGEYIPSGSDWSYFNRPYVYCLDGSAYIPDYEIGAGYVRAVAKNQTESEATVNVPLIFYRGYEARDLNTGAQLPLVNGWNNTVEVLVPGGYEGTFEVRYKGLWYWRFSDVISVVFLLGLGVWLLQGSGVSVPFLTGNKKS